MNTYILLRDNKETGPFNFEALQQTGLKPTDLIWVECQSMSWRHPYEITELKALLSGESNPQEDKTNPLLTVADIKASEIPADVLVEKKLVFVEFPMGTNQVIEKKKTVLPHSDIDDLQKYGGIANIETPKNEIASSEASIKYSRPLDEIKEMYVKNMEQKMRSHKKISFGIAKKYRQPLIYIFLLLTGAGAALFFKNTGNKKETVLPQSIQQPLSTPSIEPALEDQPQVAAIISIKTEDLPITAVDAPLSTSGEKIKEASIKKIIPKPQGDNLPATQAVDNAEKNNQSSNDKTVTKPVTAENVSSKLTLQANEFIVGSFGGIRNLEMTLQNNSSYLLDKVIVTVEYLNPEGIIIKTENIYFESVHAGEKETLAVKKSKRGVKIAYKILKIESKDISNSTAAF